MTAVQIVPLRQRACRAFILQHHRHNRSLPAGDILRVGLVKDGELVGAAFAGFPLAVELNDGFSLEIGRCCTLGTRNACTMMYGALGRAAKALGYRRLYTYTLQSEAGISPRAAGFTIDAYTDERDWSREYGQPRYHENLLGERTTPPGPKIRWIRDLGIAAL